MSVDNSDAIISEKTGRAKAFISAPLRRHLILCSLTISCFIAPAHAELISGTYSGIATLTPTATPTVLNYSFSGVGIDPARGAFVMTDQATLDIGAPPTVLTSVLSFIVTLPTASLFGAGSGTGTFQFGEILGTLDLVVTGGTGGFAGFTGEITAIEVDTIVSPTTLSVSGSYSGQVTAVPEPSTWVLMLAGFGYFGYRRTKADSVAA